MAGTKRAGHLGTLDPMATGLLLVVSGLATRLAPYFIKDEKSYRGEITLGFTSDTYDSEGVVSATGATIPIASAIDAAIQSFRGSFLQMPPLVSAKKIGGVAAYKLAREKIQFELKAVSVEVKELRWQLLGADRLEIELTCTAGTYIRSIAHDLGRLLGCGAILSKLRRTQVGGIGIAQAKTLDELAALAQSGRLAEGLTPISEMLAEIPGEYVSEDVERAIRQGRDFRTSPFVVRPGAPLVRALSRSGDLVAIGKLLFPNTYHPCTVF